MGKNKKKNISPPSQPPVPVSTPPAPAEIKAQGRRRVWPWLLVLVGVPLVGWGIAFQVRLPDSQAPIPLTPSPTAPPTPQKSDPPKAEIKQTEAPKVEPVNPEAPKSEATQPAAAEAEVYHMPIAEAVMVVVDLDYGAQVPPVAQALPDIIRNYDPEDGDGRTFAILDAHSQPAAAGKLELAMHISSEKAGQGELVFRPTGKVLWRAKFGPEVKPPKGFAGKNLFILVEDGQGKTQLVDGSKGSHSILECPLQGSKKTVADIWPEGVEREVTYFYSSCGCPVKVKSRRSGGKTVRSSDEPIIFPDDPAIAAAIGKLMGW